MVGHGRGALAMVGATLALAAFASSAAAAPVAKPADPWAWSAKSRSWSSTTKVLPPALVSRGPTTRVTRGQFLAALLKVEQLRASNQGGTHRLMQRPAPALRLADAAAGSAQARAVAYGWMTARGGKFDARAAITANEAALATAGALGLRPQVVSLTRRLRSEVPGSRVTLYSSAHALVRTLGLRWNVKDPNDALELGPNEPVNVAHGAYMLHAAATDANSWDIDEAKRLAETFDLPALGPNQRTILAASVGQLGQPYVWGGETEGAQAEGHGGFDCSGFTIRVVNSSGVPASDIAPILERTTYTQSALPAARRIAKLDLQPGDAMFFGYRGPRSRPTENFHAGVYMGNGWFIHSSGGNAGVAIDSLDGWWGERYSWGRRALTRP